MVELVSREQAEKLRLRAEEFFTNRVDSPMPHALAADVCRTVVALYDRIAELERQLLSHPNLDLRVQLAYEATRTEMEQERDAAVAAEREACYEAVLTPYLTCTGPIHCGCRERAAAAIKARGKK